MEKYINIILKLAEKAYKKSNVPVGAIVVYKNKIIGKGYNKRYKKYDVTNHAEIVAIKKAAKKLKDWRLNNCELYVTLKPCKMCEEIIKASRISKINYILSKDESKKDYYKTNVCVIGIDNKIKNDYKILLKHFFENNSLRK